jgi:hypothetical protein
MVSTYLQGNNYPLSIEEEPIISTMGPDGRPHVVPPKPEFNPEHKPLKEVYTEKGVTRPIGAPARIPRVCVVPSSERDFHLEPQPKRVLREDGFRGISRGLAKCLNELGLYEEAMCLTVGTDLGITGTAMTASQFVAAHAPYTGEKVAKKGFQLFAGNRTNRHETKNNNLVAERIRELCVSFSAMYYKEYNLLEKITQKSSPKSHKKTGRERGRPKKLVYVPTEGEIKQVLYYVCFGKGLTKAERKDPEVAKSLIILKGFLTSSEMELYEPVMPFEVVTSKQKFCGWFAALRVFKKGVCQIPTSELAKHSGVCAKTGLKYIQNHMDIKVTPNKLILRVLWKQGHDFDAVINLLPSVDEAKELMAQGWLPRDIHLRDGFGDNGEAFLYGKEGALAAKKSGTKTIYVARYSMNTYDAMESRLNPYKEELAGLIISPKSPPSFEERIRRRVPLSETEQCAFMWKDSMQCAHDVVGDGNPFCSEHANGYGNGANQKRATNSVLDEDDVEYTQETETDFLAVAHEFSPILDSIGLRQI